MSLPHAILGFLNQKPMTGYDLKQYFDYSVAHFWPADQAQIYRTLDKLAADSLVESEIEFQEVRPNRKVHSITEAGRAELAHWLAKPQQLPIHREPFLVQLFFAEQQTNEAIISQMEQQLDDHHERQRVYDAIPLPPLDDASASRQHKLARLTVELGLRSERMYIDWLEASIEVLRGLKE
ncbi:MAG: PadR family transcriptional regulator [Burkholderiales bacterium]|nr:PadR family transcriptional regulator [Anaerolineae bacterium]